MTRVLLSPFITTVWTSVVVAIISMVKNVYYDDASASLLFTIVNFDAENVDHSLRQLLDPLSCMSEVTLLHHMVLNSKF